MKIYTRTGDNGTTGLFGGPRVLKDDLRIEAYGTVDELNACLGMVRASNPGSPVNDQLLEIQNALFAVGAELASPDPVAMNTRLLTDASIENLEKWIDDLEGQLPPLKQFILPGGSLAASQLHLARSVCRRAERRVVTLAQSPEANVSDNVVRYLNRLSDLLFVQSRFVNQQTGHGDLPWTH